MRKIGCLRLIEGQAADASIQNNSGLPQELAGRPAAGWRCGRLCARPVGGANRHRGGVPMLDPKRREFIALVGGGGLLLAAKVKRAWGQQPAMPVVGFLHAGSPEPNAEFVTA